MKLIWKIVAIVAVVLLLLGIAAIAVALITGGSLEGIRNNVMLTNEQQDFEDEVPTALYVSCAAGRLTVLPGDTLRVEARNVPEGRFVCTLNDGVLTVGEKRAASWSDNLARTLSLQKEPPEFFIYLPEGTALRRTEIELTAGTAELTLPGTAADYTAKIEVGAGTVHYEGYRYSMMETKVGTGAAALVLHSTAGDMDVAFCG